MKYNFIFKGDKTNEILAHGRKFHIEKADYGTGITVDIRDNEGFNHINNTSNYDFRELVDTSKSIDEQIIEYANYILDHYTICDICGKLELVLPLASYDYEEFPQLKGKKVCQKCRNKYYIDSLNKLEQEEKEELEKQKQEMKLKGYKFMYTFWVHPGSGDDFQVDIYTNKIMPKTEIKKQQNRLRKEYSARLIEEPSYCVL